MLKIGQKVVLIFRDATEIPTLPPLGAIGEITLGLDDCGEYDVRFDDHPCPVSLPDDSWVISKNWIVPIDQNKITESKKLKAYA